MIYHGHHVLIEHHDNITGVNFIITSTRLYVPVVTFLINGNINFFENIKQEFESLILWNKCRSEITTQTKTII